MTVIVLNQVSADGALIRQLAKGQGRQDVSGPVPEGARLVAVPPDSHPVIVFKLIARKTDQLVVVRIEHQPPLCLGGDENGKPQPHPKLVAGAWKLQVFAVRSAADAARVAAGKPVEGEIFLSAVFDVATGVPTPTPTPPGPTPVPTPTGAKVGPPQWQLPAYTNGDIRVLPINPIYVAANGEDTNQGTQAAPIRTVAGVRNRLDAALRAGGKRDGILFRRGDTFAGVLTVLARDSGMPTAPFVVGAYGDGQRPRLPDAVNFNAPQWVVCQSVDMSAAGWGDRGTDGAKGRGLWLEDCVWRDWARPIVVKDNYRDVISRRCRFDDCYHRDARKPDDLDHKAIGIYFEQVGGFILLEGNKFRRIGWKPGTNTRSQFNQAVYAQSDCDAAFTAIGNDFDTVSSHCIQARAGGRIIANAFRNCETGLSIGLVNGAREPKSGGVAGEVMGNFFEDCGSQACQFDNVTTLLIADNRLRNNGAGFVGRRSQKDGTPQKSVGIGKLKVIRNRAQNSGRLTFADGLRPRELVEEDNDWTANVPALGDVAELLAGAK